LEKRSLASQRFFFVQTVGQVHHRYVHAVATSLDLQLRLVSAATCLFDVKDAPLLGASREKVLGALKHEVPTQVRETDDVEHGRT
jgi:hypothetical protein